MSKRTAMRRRLLWWALAVLVGLGVALLLGEDGALLGASHDAGPLDGASEDVRLRSAAGRADGSEAGPALRAGGQQRGHGVPRGPVTVRLLDPQGQPVPYACILAGPRRITKPDGVGVVTDAAGFAVVADVPQDGSWSVGAWSGQPPSVASLRGADEGEGASVGEPLRGGLTRPARAPVTGPEVVLETGSAWQVRVSVVEADTGRMRPDARVRWPGDRSRSSLAWAAAPATFRLVWSRGAPWSASLDHLEVEAPRGFVAWDEIALQGRPCSAARLLHHVVPLRRSVGATLVPTSSEGDVADVRCGTIRLGDLAVGFIERVDGAGHLRIAGIPYLRSEPVQFSVHTDDLRLHGSVVASLAPVLGPLGPVSIPLQRSEVQEDIPVSNGELISERLFYQDVYFDEDWLQELAGRSHPTASDEPFTTVTVLRRDGTPARRVWVEIAWVGEHGEEDVIEPVVVSGQRMRVPLTGWTGADGVARVPRMAPGRYMATAFQSGFVDARRVLGVPVGGVDRFALHEGEGGTLSVEIVDHEGRALPFARCHVNATSRREYVDIHDGVQRMDTFTDEHGRRLYRDVPPGPVTLTCAWGARKTHVEVTLRAGERKDVRVTMAPTPDKK